MNSLPTDRQGKVIPMQPNPGASPFNLAVPPPGTSPRPQGPGGPPQGVPYQTQSMPNPYGSAPAPYPPPTAPTGPPGVYEYKTMQPVAGSYATPPPPGYGAPAQPYGAPYGQPQSQPYGSGSPYGQPGYPPPPMARGGQSVSLVKGGNVSLSKVSPGLMHIRVGLGWDVRQTQGAAFDLDASAFLLKGDGRVRFSQDLIFYNNKQSVDGSVFHNGDNLTGAGEGDDEVLSIDLMRVPPDVQKAVFVVSIYDAVARGQNFGQVSRAFIRVVNADTNQEICRYDLTEEASMDNCMIFGEVYRYGGEWKFRAIGQTIQGGLRACGQMFGLNMQ